MNELDIIEAIACCDETLLQKADTRQYKHNRLPKYFAWAACVSLVVALSLVIPRIANKLPVDNDAPTPYVTDTSTDETAQILDGLDYVIDKEYSPEFFVTDMNISINPATGSANSYDAFVPSMPLWILK